MKIGAMRHRVRVERSSDGLDDYGQPTRLWGLVAKAWADVQPISGRELLQAGKLDGQITHRVWMRHCDAHIPKPTDRLVADFGTLNVVSVINHGQRGHALELLCLQEV